MKEAKYKHGDWIKIEGGAVKKVISYCSIREMYTTFYDGTETHHTKTYIDEHRKLTKLEKALK